LQKSILQSTTIVDLINGYYKLRNMYNNDSIGVSSTTTINKIQNKFPDMDGRLTAPTVLIDSKLSSSPASPAKSDLSNSNSNNNNLQAYFDDEFEDEEEDEDEEDDKDKEEAT